MTGRLFAIERWAARSPRVRHPLLLLALLLLVGLAGGITGCGDSSDSPTPPTVAELCPVAAPVAMDIVTNGPVDSKAKKDRRAAVIQLAGASMPAEIRGRGNSTWAMPKKPYRFELAAPAPLLGMAPARNWVLLANYADKTLLRTTLAWCLGKLAGAAATPEARYVELTLNGDYLGLYQLTWQVESAPQRVPAEGGFLAEIDARRDGDVVIESRIGPPYVVDEDMASAAQAAIPALEAAVLAGTWRPLVDQPALRAYYLVAELSKNNDVFWRSTYLFKPADGPIRFGPLWDFDLAFGNVDYSAARDPADWWARWAGLMAAFLADPAFDADVAADWRRLRRHLPQLQQWLADTAATLDAAQARNFARWPILGIYVWPNPVVTGSYAGEVQYLQGWLAARATWLDGALGAGTNTVTASAEAQGGDASTGAPTLVLPQPGPTLHLQQPAQVRVRLSTLLLQHAHYAAVGTAGVQLQAPVPTSASTLPLALTAGMATLPLVYEVTMRLPAGTHNLVAAVTVHAHDAAHQPTGALAQARATAGWVVEVLP